MISIERWCDGIDNAAAAVDVEIVRLDSSGLQHGDQERRFVFAIAVAISVDIACVVRLPSPDAANHYEIADVLLDVSGDAAESCV